MTRAAPLSDLEAAALASDIAPTPYHAGALISSALAASGLPRAEVVRRIADATGRTTNSVSASLSKAIARPDAAPSLLRLVCLATGRRVTTEPSPS